MRIARKEVPVKIDVPGAVARQQTGFGDASGYGTIGAEYFSIAAGTDFAPLLKGLEGDACQSPHWGYVIQGAITVSYSDGAEEKVSAEDLFYWPPGHSISIHEDAEIILFSPQHEHNEVINHVKSKVGG